MGIQTHWGFQTWVKFIQIYLKFDIYEFLVLCNTKFNFIICLQVMILQGIYKVARFSFNVLDDKNTIIFLNKQK